MVRPDPSCVNARQVHARLAAVRPPPHSADKSCSLLVAPCTYTTACMFFSLEENIRSLPDIPREPDQYTIMSAAS